MASATNASNIISVSDMVYTHNTEILCYCVYPMSEYTLVSGTRKSIFVPQSLVLDTKGIMERLRTQGGIGAYFQPWDFDFLSRPFHVPGGRTLEYVAATEVKIDPGRIIRGTYYPFQSAS